MKAIGWIAVCLLGVPLALAQAATLSTLWSWFIAPQYGAGPSYSTWYGITTVLGIIAVMHQPPTTADKPVTLKDLAVLLITKLIVLPVCLGMAWCIGQLLGWL